MQNKKILVGAFALVFVIGFFAGMEYKAYQIKSALVDAFAGVGEAFAGEDTTPTPSVDTSAQVSNDLTKKVGLEITKKGFSTANYQSTNDFTFTLSNTSGKDIEGVQGSVTFSDLFGNTIKSVKLSYDDGLKIDENKLYPAQIDYNQFMDEDIKLKQTDLAKLKYTWEVDTIVYTDGTTEKY